MKGWPCVEQPRPCPDQIHRWVGPQGSSRSGRRCGQLRPANRPRIERWGRRFDSGGGSTHPQLRPGLASALLHGKAPVQPFARDLPVQFVRCESGSAACRALETSLAAGIPGQQRVGCVVPRLCRCLWTAGWLLSTFGGIAAAIAETLGFGQPAVFRVVPGSGSPDRLRASEGWRPAVRTSVSRVMRTVPGKARCSQRPPRQ